MAAMVQLRNERTSEIKAVKVGWSWTLFLFSSVAGIPLLARGLYKYGAGMAALSVAAAVASAVDSPVYGLLILFQIIASVQFGRLGNRLTALHYLENGWEWAAPDDQETMYAREKWALA
ncbi:hypothetical protein [Sphingomonas sp. CFBP 8760]|uniref:hypothetical protein n=1 Tax=Sphingomonas sp. CFBP 8760 TaxID=2775282 RepID=UPI001780B077|nr:hypothetical protein [Sphingomonas sp. CFBP 8760]MBD8546062.1 hypothetical protein [Sphingomonas sp. CFBP 8760]